MSTLYGIATTPEGGYCLAGISCTASGWRIGTVLRWNSGNAFVNYIPIPGGVYCATGAGWKSKTTFTPSEAVLVSPESGPFSPYEHKSTIDRLYTELSGSLLGIVPGDAFLCTVPLSLGAAKGSFIAVFAEKEMLKIGIISDDRLIVVFTMQGTCDELESHLARICRYCKRTYPELEFPERLYLIGQETPAFDGFSCITISLPVYKGTAVDSSVLQALGAALLRRAGSIPVFAGPTPESVFRKFRTVLYVSAAAILLIAYIAGVVGWAFNKKEEAAVRNAENRYHAMIDRNAGIKKVIAVNDSLAAQIIQLAEKDRVHTRWAEFLEKIGEARPEGVFFDRMGSEPGKAGSSTMRIMVSGWSPGEPSVTDLLERLQKIGCVYDISLASIERSSDNMGKCRFTIVCSLAS